MKYIPICVIIIKTLTNNIIQCIHTLIKSWKMTALQYTMRKTKTALIYLHQPRFV